MLEYNEITVRKRIIYDGEPYECVASHVFRKQQRKPVNATKLRNMMTGNIKEILFINLKKWKKPQLISEK